MSLITLHQLKRTDKLFCHNVIKLYSMLFSCFFFHFIIFVFVFILRREQTIDVSFVVVVVVFFLVY